MEWTPEQIAKLDPQDMYGKIVDFPAQLREGYNLPAIEGEKQIDVGDLTAIIVVGMGGSAIGGDMLRSYLSDELQLPIFVNRNYSLPGFVNEKCLVIAASYSGNTEETLAAYAEAETRGCPIFVATTGGKLGELASAAKLPRVTLPKGFQPRAALGYSFGPLLSFVEKLGLTKPQADIVESACQFLAENRQAYTLETPTADNRAKQIAEKLVGKIAVIYAGADFYDTVAVRVKGQICENAKHLAYANICPEFNHNELVGFEHPEALLDKLAVLFLTGPEDSKQVTARFEILQQIIGERGLDTVTVQAAGPNRLAQIFSLVQLGDFVSFYLAMANQVDPSPVKVIDRLKGELERKT
jgi:glucose/mannose-6-phosphate isomerase